MRSIVVGLGNPVLSDDAVGLRIVEQLRRELGDESDTDTAAICCGGLHLLDAIAGYDRAVLIDAMVTPGAQPGRIHTSSLAALRETRNSGSAHDTSLAVALELGRMAGLRVPAEVRIWAIEAADVETFGERLTPEVERAAPEVVKQVMQALSEGRR